MGEVVRHQKIINSYTIQDLAKKYPNDMELGRRVRELVTPTQDEKDYLEFWTCEYCGKHTHEVEYDYLGGGTNHLQCELERAVKLGKD